MKSLTFTAILPLAILFQTSCDTSKSSNNSFAGGGSNSASEKSIGARLKAHAQKQAARSKPATKAGETLPPLTEARLRSLILDLEKCKLTERGIEESCPQYRSLKTAKRERKAWVKNLQKAMGPMGRKLLVHTSNAVRHHAVTLMGSGWVGGVKKGDAKIIIKASKIEKDTSVLKNMIYTLASNQSKDRSVGKWILAFLSHAEPVVRKQAAMSLSTWGKKTKGSGKALLQTINTDQSIEVRQAACKGIGNLGDNSVVASMERILTEKSTDIVLYEACFIGLIKMWTRYVLPPKKPSAKAYKLTLALLNRKPRDTKHPPFQIVNYFSGLKSKSPQQKKWRKAAKFYRADDFEKAASAIVADPKTSWICRNAFIGLLADMGASKDTLTSLRKTYAGKEKEGSNNFVVRTLDKRIAVAR
jgi:hypothetical protein